MDEEGSERIKQLEDQVAILTKQNSKLKNELKFTTETERRTSGEYIASLQKDVESLQTRNEQVSSALMRAEAQIKNNELSHAKVEAASSANLAAQSAALVERLSSAQRERERILAGQLRKVMDEKQQLQKRLQDEGLDAGIVETGSDEASSEEAKDMPSLVDSLQTASGVLELQQGGDKLIKRLKEIQNVKWRNIQSKIDMLMQESLEAVGKRQLAEEKAEKLKRQLEMLKTEYKLVDKTRIKSLQSQLQTAQSERDSWQKRAEKFEDTCETLRVLSSLQKSMSKEEEIKRKYEEELLRSQEDIEHLTKQLNQVVLERNQLVQERSQLIAQTHVEFERAERLQRLVVILRKKLRNNSASLNNSDRLESSSSSPVYDI